MLIDLQALVSQEYAAHNAVIGIANSLSRLRDSDKPISERRAKRRKNYSKQKGAEI